MRKDFVRFGVLAGVLVLGGCRFKGVESFYEATTPVDYAKQRAEFHVKGDPYGNGGIAYASAGSKVKTPYGTGADPNATGKLDPRMDLPTKGSGQEPGEQGGDAAPGFGQSNSPANQPGSSDQTSTMH